MPAASVRAELGMRKPCLEQPKGVPVSGVIGICSRAICCCAGLRAVPALGARQRVQAWYARGLLSVKPLLLGVK